MTPTEEYILQMLRYDPISGELRWSKQHVLRGGQIAGSLDLVSGYLRVQILEKCYQVSRVCWFIFYKKWPVNDLDHYPDHNRTNNRISNLRDVTKSVNSFNRKGAQKNSKSGIIGVSFDVYSGRWRAHASRYYIGGHVCIGKVIKMRKEYAEIVRMTKIS